MKPTLTKLLAPILNLFEKGEQPEHYDASHRKILMIMGALFFVLAGVSLYFAFKTDVMAALLPTLIFAAIGFVSVVIAWLGSDRAVSNIWRSR